MSRPRSASLSLQVFKFGGSSVGTAEAIRLAAGHVIEHMPGVLAVVSAMSGVTDLLLGGLQAALAGSRDQAERAAVQFFDRHVDTVRKLITDRAIVAALEGEVRAATDEYLAIVGGVAILRELTTRTKDLAIARGERMLARIFTAFLGERLARQGKRRAIYVDACEIIETELKHGSLWPALDRTRALAQEKLVPLLEKKDLVVVPGFIGTGPEGELVTLGRGGTDFSASVLARSIGAKSVTLYKEVDGLLTADPKRVKEARVIPELHYREAAELAYYGAKVLHPRTMIPLVDKGITLWVKNTFNAAFSGTRIGGDVKAGEYPVKALSAINEQALISIEGNGMIGVPGIAARTFTALSQAGHSVGMISQASSEASICFVVPVSEAKHAVAALSETFAVELEAKLIDAIRVENDISLVAVVGLGMRGRPGIAARVCSALSRERINIVAVAQGSSELNITLALKQADVETALSALHREFRLDKLRALPDTQGREASLCLFGFGQIGGALAGQIVSQTNYFRHDLGLALKCIALADRSGLKVAHEGFSAEALLTLRAHKSQGQRLFPKQKKTLSLTEMAGALEHGLFTLALHRPVFVDLTAEETAPLLLLALKQNFHVVVANKKPLAVTQEKFDEMFEVARARDLMLRYEATVGAGLPVLDTLQKLKEAGDHVRDVQGCLSGTLGYLMTQLEQGVAFSEAVTRAHALGYTEPDPKEDLSGMDVGRKALILARTLGRKLDLSDIDVEALYPPEMAKLSAQQFLAALPKLDKAMADRVTTAARKQKVLRYVASIGPRSVRVGLQAVAADSPMGRLKGTDNQVVLTTDRYSTNPLVVTGPGAGAEVTAAGVLNDIVAIARM